MRTYIFYDYYAEGIICQARTNNKSRERKKRKLKVEEEKMMVVGGYKICHL